MSDDVALGWVIPLVFLVSGLALLAVACRHFLRTRTFLARAIETVGEVLELTEEPPTEAGERTTFRPVVSFRTSAGTQMQFASMAPESPHEARIRSFTSLWLLAIVLGVLGSVFAALGIALLLGAISL